MHYLWLILFGAAIGLQYHCFKLKKLLGSEYQMFVGGLGIIKLHPVVGNLQAEKKK